MWTLLKQEPSFHVSKQLWLGAYRVEVARTMLPAGDFRTLSTASHQVLQAVPGVLEVQGKDTRLPRECI